MKEFINLTIGIKFNKIIYNYFKHYILKNIFKFIYIKKFMKLSNMMIINK